MVPRRDAGGIQKRCLMKLVVFGLVIAQTSAAFHGLNLRRRPCNETDAALHGQETETEINRAASLPVSDPQQVTSAVTGNIPASQPVLVSCEFENKWTQETHPTDYPRNAHWSPIVLASHSDQYNMWSAGALASRGVEEVAEVSDKSEEKPVSIQQVSHGRLFHL